MTLMETKLHAPNTISPAITVAKSVREMGFFCVGGCFKSGVLSSLIDDAMISPLRDSVPELQRDHLKVDAKPQREGIAMAPVKYLKSAQCCFWGPLWPHFPGCPCGEIVCTTGGGGGGATTTGSDATPPQLSAKTCGGAGQLGRGGGGSAGGCVGGGGILAARGGGGALHATHYYHMHTSRVCVCLGAWRYRGMYAIIAISHLCQEESLKGLKDQRHSNPLNEAPSTKHGRTNLAPLAPWPPHRYLSKLGGEGEGLGGVAYKDWARPPPPGCTTA